MKSALVVGMVVMVILGAGSVVGPGEGAAMDGPTATPTATPKFLLPTFTPTPGCVLYFPVVEVGSRK